MVEWKGEIDRNNSGKKAALLDKLQDFNIPNFFTLTRNDVEALVGDPNNSDEILNTDFSEEQITEIKSAYKQIGMSSEVREASGKAKSLVGGQRDTGRVSVRVSSEGTGYEYKLNVGVSDIENALREVIASYHEEKDELPSIIVQKMVESGHSGAFVQNYLGSYTLVEVVEGLGISLEEGITSPETHLIKNGHVEETRVPESQIKITRNPMNGQHRRKKLVKDSPSIKKSHLRDFYEELSEIEYSVKFVYKRGTFYIIDVFEAEDGYNPFSNQETSLRGIRASEGEIKGAVGREVSFSEQTRPPEEYGRALISKSGGYTSTDALKARKAGKPVIFNYKGEFEEGQQVEFSERAVESRRKNRSESKVAEDIDMDASDTVTATEVLPIDGRSRSVHLSPPFGDGYSVGHGQDSISSENYITTYQDVFAFSGDKAILDIRKISDPGIKEAIGYIEADLKILVVDKPEKDVIQTAIKNRYDVIASSSNLENLRSRVLRQEKRFILDKVSGL